MARVCVCEFGSWALLSAHFSRPQPTRSPRKYGQPELPNIRYWLELAARLLMGSNRIS